MKPYFLLLCATAFACHAQQPSPEKKAAKMFEQMDLNQDGQLDRQELPERLRAHFDRIDTDLSGSISKTEHLKVLSRSKGPDAKTSPRSIPIGIEALLDLPYADSNNPRQKLDLFLPKKRLSEQTLPVIAFIHGGGWKGGNKTSGLNNLARFVQSGHYAGISIGYRLTSEAQWPAQIHDCKAAIRWIKANAKKHGIDASKIAVWGTSAGGHLVSFLGTSSDVKELEGKLGKHLDQTSQVTCVVNYFGPENFLTMVRQPSTVDRSKGKEYPEALLLGGPVQERETTAKEASPVTHVSKGDAPFFTAPGNQDPLVPFAQGQELHAALLKASVPSLFQEMTNGGHGFKSSILDARVTQFLDLHLRGISSEIVTAPIVVEEQK